MLVMANVHVPLILAKDLFSNPNHVYPFNNTIKYLKQIIKIKIKYNKTLIYMISDNDLYYPFTGQLSTFSKIVDYTLFKGPLYNK